MRHQPSQQPSHNDTSAEHIEALRLMFPDKEVEAFQIALQINNNDFDLAVSTLHHLNQMQQQQQQQQQY